MLGRRLALLSSVFGLAVAVTPLAEKSWARMAAGGWVLGTLLTSVSLLLNRVRTPESRIERLRLTYLAIGAGASVLFTALDLIGRRYDIPCPSLGPIFSTLYLFFLAQTLLRLRLMDLHELLGKIASQTVLAFILAAVFTVLTVWVDGNTGAVRLQHGGGRASSSSSSWSRCGSRWRSRWWPSSSASASSCCARWARCGRAWPPSSTSRKLARMLLDALHETGRVTHASVYLLAEDRPGYRLLDSRGPPPGAFLDTAAARGLLLAAAPGRRRCCWRTWSTGSPRCGCRPPRASASATRSSACSDTRAALVQMKSGISVPLVGNDRVIGFLNLWDERVPEAYASDEIALILSVAERVATVLENSKLYEKIRERDRLAALGEMAAGLAHEIRNPLGAIKGAAQCLDPKRLPGEDGEFLGVIVEEVNRLNGVVTAFLDYARPLKQSFGPTDLNEVVTRTMRLIQNDVPKQIELAVQLDLRRAPRGRGRRAAQAGAHQPGAERGAGHRRAGRPHHRGHREAGSLRRVPRQPRTSSSRSTSRTPVPASRRISNSTSSCPSSPPSRRARAWGWPSVSESSRTTGAASRCTADPARAAPFVIRLPALPAEPQPVEAAPTEGAPLPAPPPSLPPSAEESRDSLNPKPSESKSKREKKRKAG